jgi:hypothetical protein
MMLYWNTVNDLLRESLLILMLASELKDFRLVGGTALSLHLGHRMSVDIDLFTDASYGSIDFDAIEDFLKTSFGYVEGDFGGNPGMGKSYMIGPTSDNLVKLDIYYSMDPFFQESVVIDNIRLASIEEIIAMKVDVIQRGGRKKDFWDIHELLDSYTISQMIGLHALRFEWTHNEAQIRNNFILFHDADLEPDPICLKNKEWVFIMEDIEDAVRL